jgi:hypothetical protein
MDDKVTDADGRSVSSVGTGEWRMIRDSLIELRKHQMENSDRLTAIEKTLLIQQEHNKSIERAFADIAKLYAKAEEGERVRQEIRHEHAILIARGKTAWKVASIFWAMFGGIILTSAVWTAGQLLEMRDQVAEMRYYNNSKKIGGD